MAHGLRIRSWLIKILTNYIHSYHSFNSIFAGLALKHDNQILWLSRSSSILKGSHPRKSSPNSASPTSASRSSCSSQAANLEMFFSRDTWHAKQCKCPGTPERSAAWICRSFSRLNEFGTPEVAGQRGDSWEGYTPEIILEVDGTTCLVFGKWSSKGPCHPLP